MVPEVSMGPSGWRRFPEALEDLRFREVVEVLSCSQKVSEDPRGAQGFLEDSRGF